MSFAQSSDYEEETFEKNLNTKDINRLCEQRVQIDTLFRLSQNRGYSGVNFDEFDYFYGLNINLGTDQSFALRQMDPLKINELSAKCMNNIVDNLLQMQTTFIQNKIKHLELEALKIEEKYSLELTELGKLLTDSKSDLNSLLINYQILVIKTRNNLSPNLTDLLLKVSEYISRKVFEHKETKNLIPLNWYYINPHPEDSPLYSEYSKKKASSFEHFNKSLSKIAQNKTEEIKKLKDSVNKLNSLNTELLSEYSKIEIVEGFVELAKSMKRQLHRTRSNGESSKSGGFAIAGIGGGGGGSIVRSNGIIQVCYNNTCIDAKHLYDNFYWAEYNEGYVVIENTTLKNAYLSKKLLLQIAKDAECNDGELTLKDWSKVLIKSGGWTLAIIGTSILDLSLDLYDSYQNKELNLDFNLTKEIYQKSQESVGFSFDNAIDRKRKSANLKSQLNSQMLNIVSRLIHVTNTSRHPDLEQLECNKSIDVKVEIKDNLK